MKIINVFISHLCLCANENQPLQVCLQLFRERLSYKRGKAYATMSKATMGNGGFYGCLSEPQGVSAWRKENYFKLLSSTITLVHFWEEFKVSLMVFVNL